MPDELNQDDAQGVARAGQKVPLMITSEELFGNDKLVIIRHKQEDYLLRITASGKLILTK
jgi:hemin uptake protein HemP